jgi:hypothetical protein
VYLAGKGDVHMGPGTALIQRIDWSRANENQLMKAARGVGPGLGTVGCVPEFFSDCRTMSQNAGMGCACGGTCGGCGLGLFDSGMDFTTWGWPEWAIVGTGVYAALSLLGDSKRGYQRVGRVGKAVRRAA